MPAESLSKIMKIAFKEFNKNPKKFISSLNNGGFQKALITKGIIKAGAIASAT